MSLFKRSDSTSAGSLLAAFFLAYLLWGMSKTAVGPVASVAGPFIKVWRWFWNLHFGWQMAIFLRSELC